MVDKKWIDQELTIKLTWRNVILAGLLSPLAAFLAFFVLISESSAAWVQAIGSIGAIFVAIAVSSAADRKASRQRLGDDYLYMEKVYVFSKQASGAIDTAINTMGMGAESGERYVVKLPALTSAFRVLEPIRESLGAVDPMRVADIRLALAFVDLKRCFSYAYAIVADSRESGETPDELRFMKFAELIHDRTTEIKRLLERYRTAHNLMVSV